MDIEEDIKIVKELNNLLKFFRTHGWIPNLSRKTNINEPIEAIEHILAEREEDKKKIAELEEHQEKFYKGELYTAKQLKQIEENQKKYFINKQKVKEELEEAEKENEPYEKYNKESRAYWINQGKISLAKKLLEDK